MSKQANPVVIGGFVLGAVVLTVAAILVFGSGALFKDRISVVTYFPGTVQGLTVGARVEFQGVQVGQVTDIKLDYWPQEGRFSIPVYYELWPDALRTYDQPAGSQSGGSAEHTRNLIEAHGLRARLAAVSLVTGQYMVALGLHPGTEARYVGDDAGRVEIPAIESTRDRIANVMEDLDLKGLVTVATETLTGVQRLVAEVEGRALTADVEAVLSATRALLERLDAELPPLFEGAGGALAAYSKLAESADATLGEYARLAQTASTRTDALAVGIERAASRLAAVGERLEAEVGPVSRSAVATLKRADRAFEAIEEVVAEDSAPRVNLNVLLEEAAGAARALRLLADYLEQNPDALIKGRY